MGQPAPPSSKDRGRAGVLIQPLRPAVEMTQPLMRFLSFAVFAPLLRLSPPPSDKDYYFNLDDSEGVCDLFDVPLV